jgi:hypothetical protein
MIAEGSESGAGGTPPVRDHAFPLTADVAEVPFASIVRTAETPSGSTPASITRPGSPGI